MVQIKEVSYGSTFNQGNYESERIDLTATIDPDDDVQEVVADLRQQAYAAHKAGSNGR